MFVLIHRGDGFNLRFTEMCIMGIRTRDTSGAQSRTACNGATNVSQRKKTSPRSFLMACVRNAMSRSFPSTMTSSSLQFNPIAASRVPLLQMRLAKPTAHHQLPRSSGDQQFRRFCGSLHHPAINGDIPCAAASHQRLS